MDLTEYKKYLNELSTEELHQEQRDLGKSVQNEQIWHLGSTTDEDIRIHEENLNILAEKISYINQLIRNKKNL